MRHQWAAEFFSKAHGDDQGNEVWALSEETSRVRVGTRGLHSLCLEHGTRTQVLRVFH